MKNKINIVGFLIIVHIMTISCNGVSKEGNGINLKTRIDSTRIKDSLAALKNSIEPATVICRLYFKSEDIFDEESGVTTSGYVGVRDEFTTKKRYTFCYDSEKFHSVSLSGSGTEIIFIIKEGDQEIFRKEGIDLVDKIVFSSNDISIEMGKKYTVIAMQNETILFESKIDSQGCL